MKVSWSIEGKTWYNGLLAPAEALGLQLILFCFFCHLGNKITMIKVGKLSLSWAFSLLVPYFCNKKKPKSFEEEKYANPNDLCKNAILWRLGYMTMWFQFFWLQSYLIYLSYAMVSVCNCRYYDDKKTNLCDYMKVRQHLFKSQCKGPYWWQPRNTSIYWPTVVRSQVKHWTLARLDEIRLNI